jgi:hypothetical protein
MSASRERVGSVLAPVADHYATIMQDRATSAIKELAPIVPVAVGDSLMTFADLANKFFPLAPRGAALGSSLSVENVVEA